MNHLHHSNKIKFPQKLVTSKKDIFKVCKKHFNKLNSKLFLWHPSMFLFFKYFLDTADMNLKHKVIHTQSKTFSIHLTLSIAHKVKFKWIYYKLCHLNVRTTRHTFPSHKEIIIFRFSSFTLQSHNIFYAYLMTSPPTCTTRYFRILIRSPRINLF